MAAAFPKTQYFKTFATGETVLCGGISGFDAQQLRQIIMVLYIHGATAGTETLQAKIWHDHAMTKLYASSNSFVTNDITNLADYWRGRIGFTFASKPWLDPDATYYVSVSVDGYTRNSDDFYMALMFDWPFPINENTGAPSYSLQMDVRGNRRVRY